MDFLTTITLKQKVRKEPKYWQAWQNGKVIDGNNSLPLLRHKWGKAAIYRSVR